MTAVSLPTIVGATGQQTEDAVVVDCNDGSSSSGSLYNLFFSNFF
jgi:hypothetical protein